MDNNIEQIEIEVPQMQFEYKGIQWSQQGYELIGITPNGMRFGTRIDKNLRMIGVDENNRPQFKRIGT